MNAARTAGMTVLLAIGLLAQSASAGGRTPGAQPRTPAAVVAADDAWLRAEIAGDGDALEALLAPGYVTVDPAGRVTDRERLIAAARKRGPSPQRAAQVEAWRARHPTRPAVQLFGDTAVLRWEVDAPGAPATISSIDVFVYSAGRWRAIHSQHSSASS